VRKQRPIQAENYQKTPYSLRVFPAKPANILEKCLNVLQKQSPQYFRIYYHKPGFLARVFTLFIGHYGAKFDEFRGFWGERGLLKKK
jgi:hypothetical protein